MTIIGWLSAGNIFRGRQKTIGLCFKNNGLLFSLLFLLFVFHFGEGNNVSEDKTRLEEVVPHLLKSQTGNITVCAETADNLIDSTFCAVNASLKNKQSTISVYLSE